jgi:hypothetical protein
MISPETPLASGAPRSAHARSACERAMKVFAALLFTATFLLAGASTATAAPAVTSNSAASPFDPPPPCRGEQPGVCPSSDFAKLNEITATDSSEESATDQLPES